MSEIPNEANIDCLGKLAVVDNGVRIDFYRPEGGGALERIAEDKPFPYELLEAQQSKPTQCNFWGDDYWVYKNYVLQFVNGSSFDIDGRHSIMNYVFSLELLLDFIEHVNNKDGYYKLGIGDGCGGILESYTDFSKNSLKKATKEVATARILSAIESGDFDLAWGIVFLCALENNAIWRLDHHQIIEKGFKEFLESTLRQYEADLLEPYKVVFDIVLTEVFVIWKKLKLGEVIFSNDERLAKDAQTIILRLIANNLADEIKATQFIYLTELFNKEFPVSVLVRPVVRGSLKYALKQLVGTITDVGKAEDIVSGANRIFYRDETDVWQSYL